jgi:hypothetical protein
MKIIVEQVRVMTEADTAEYSLAGQTYWSDRHLVDILDGERDFMSDVRLMIVPKTLDGTVYYRRYEFPYRGMIEIEGTANGTANFRIHDSTGADIDFADFTFNARDRSISFIDDQAGSVRYWSGFIYDVNAAAKQIWLRKAAHAYKAINFSADGHKFDREAIHAHCIEMAKQFGYQGGIGSATMIRTDLGAPGEGF